jgi:hypothetical protein
MFASIPSLHVVCHAVCHDVELGRLVRWFQFFGQSIAKAEKLSAAVQAIRDSSAEMQAQQLELIQHLVNGDPAAQVSAFLRVT